MGIGVNGIRVPEAFLNHGDLVNIGSFNLRFLMKDQAAPVRLDMPAVQHAPIGLPPNPQPQPEPPAAMRSLVVIEDRWPANAIQLVRRRSSRAGRGPTSQ